MQNCPNRSLTSSAVCISSAMKADITVHYNLKNANCFEKPSVFPIFCWTFGVEFDKIIHNKNVPQGWGDSLFINSQCARIGGGEK